MNNKQSSSISRRTLLAATSKAVALAVVGNATELGSGETQATSL